jgi:hypothetical protein
VTSRPGACPGDADPGGNPGASGVAVVPGAD